MKNISPWIHQLNKKREAKELKSDAKTDIAIVGGGIAGVSTAFFVLRNTDKSVILLEGGRLGHGATGHNAGQLTSYFARSLSSLVEEFGVEKTIAAQKHVEEDAWELLDTMYTEAGLNIPLSRFIGHLGISNKDHLLSILNDNEIRIKAGLRAKEILIADHAPFVSEIEEKYKDLFSLVPHETILERLETKAPEFIACLSEQKGCMNSALFTERVAEFLLEKYRDRFVVYEYAHVNKVVLHDNQGLLDCLDYTVEAERVVLATNGFDNLNILNKSGLDIDTRFHYSISGKVGYMSGYLEKLDKPPIAISYFTDPDASSDDPYFYLTRREFEHGEEKRNLISVGGLDIDLEDRRLYERDHEYPERAKDSIDTFIKSVYHGNDDEKIDYIFTWHGLMGYTTNLIRLVGAEPKNPTLIYNLGCNGVGILPSVFGADRISRIIKGEGTDETIFDPKNY